MTALTLLGEPWAERARCRGYFALYFPPKADTDDSAKARRRAGKSSQVTHRQAVELCGGCPVRRQCLALAMKAEGNAGAHSRYGVYGGLTPTQRRRLYERRVDRQNEAQLATAATSLKGN